MTAKNLVRLSNIVGISAIILLIYWVFIFVSVEVFGFKVFRENMSETFFMSILGILAVMFGALMMNLMFNLTRIAQKHNQDSINDLSPNFKKIIILFVLSFPLIFGLLFLGNHLTSQKKETMLIESAQHLIEDNTEKSSKLLNYTFSKQWLIESDNTLDLMSKTDKHFPQVALIVKDSIDGFEVYLMLRNYYHNPGDTIQPAKKDFIFATTQQEREYLKKVFDEKNNEKRFSAHNGNYELYYPYYQGDKRIILYFSDQQRYGKIGS